MSGGRRNPNPVNYGRAPGNYSPFGGGDNTGAYFNQVKPEPVDNYGAPQQPWNPQYQQQQWNPQGQQPNYQQGNAYSKANKHVRHLPTIVEGQETYPKKNWDIDLLDYFGGVTSTCINAVKLGGSNRSGANIDISNIGVHLLFSSTCSEPISGKAMLCRRNVGAATPTFDEIFSPIPGGQLLSDTLAAAEVPPKEQLVTFSNASKYANSWHRIPGANEVNNLEIMRTWNIDLAPNVTFVKENQLYGAGPYVQEHIYFKRLTDPEYARQQARGKWQRGHTSGDFICPMETEFGNGPAPEKGALFIVVAFPETTKFYVKGSIKTRVRYFDSQVFR